MPIFIVFYACFTVFYSFGQTDSPIRKILYIEKKYFYYKIFYPILLLFFLSVCPKCMGVHKILLLLHELLCFQSMRYCELDPYFVRFNLSEFVRLSEMKMTKVKKLLLSGITVVIESVLQLAYSGLDSSSST